QIVNISALSGLTNLAYLALGSNQIGNISALSDLANLAELDLSHNQIVGISALSGLTKLTVLYLNNNKIHDIAPLVNNAGIDSGDAVDLVHNQLHFESGSPSMLDIEALRQRRVGVTYLPQDCATCD
ncbi:unnamed protein product, partial [marine sediment metagenome]